MMIEPATLMGVVMLGAVSYAIAVIALWRQPRAIKWFAIALITVGLGYLATTEVPMMVSKATIGHPR